ncbi:MAG: 2-hydroxyacyl-CoA dehydratase [Bacillota bacterium]|nr:2-hydroxyacyl-CoA dehydratase [Bacillota bacterium]
MGRIGFTTTIPVEIIYAAGKVPVDLNNVFVTHPNPEELLCQAEKRGFPRNSCAWIKGIYSALMGLGDVDCIIGVVEGDCSNTRALLEVLELEGIDYVPFSYPRTRNEKRLKEEIDSLMRAFGVDYKRVMEIKGEIDMVRRKVQYLDELTYKYNKVSGFENHLWQVSCSDFEGDYREYGAKVDALTVEAEKRAEFTQPVRLGYVGVPPVFPEIYQFIEEHGARIVFNEVQRQFTLAPGGFDRDIYQAYRDFTYPYSLEDRLQDIRAEISNRGIDGIIHYTQAFCFRGIEDIVVKERIDTPVLMIEGDRPGGLDARTKLRIESFIEMLHDLK